MRNPLSPGASRQTGERRYAYVHFSSVANRDGILAVGLSPACDARSKARVWLAAKSKVSWAFAHVCQTHGIDPEGVDAWLVDGRGLDVRRHRKGVYYTNVQIPRNRLYLLPRVSRLLLDNTGISGR